MTEIFREIDEELREDQFKEQWQKYGKYVIAVVALVIAGVAGYKGWESYTANQRNAAAAAYQSALVAASGEQFDEAAATLETLIADGPSGYQLVARLRQAALLAEAGDPGAAAAAFEDIAGDSSVDPLFQELALIRMVMADADSGDPAALIDRLRPLSLDGKPWRYTARELMAALHLRQADSEAARTILTGLTEDTNAPNGARTRAAELLRILSQ